MKGVVRDADQNMVNIWALKTSTVFSLSDVQTSQEHSGRMKVSLMVNRHTWSDVSASFSGVTKHGSLQRVSTDCMRSKVVQTTNLSANRSPRPLVDQRLTSTSIHIRLLLEDV